MPDETKLDTTRVRMNTTVASGTRGWEIGQEYDVDSETARAWIRDRVATPAGIEMTTEEVRSEVEEVFVPRASEVDPAALAPANNVPEPAPASAGRRQRR